ncbi:hypothetical protein M569_05860, partial [Genlisea aurea]
MAMTRILSQSMPGFSLRPLNVLINHQRHRSNKTHRAQLIEVDLDAASPSQHDSADSALEVISVGMNRLEDAIRGIIVRRAAPDWLPFLPGFSYWVPPRPSALRNHPVASLADVIGKLGFSENTMNSGFPQELSDDQQMSLNSSSKGWPSSVFFIEGISPIPVMEMEMKVRDNEEKPDDDS